MMKDEINRMATSGDIDGLITALDDQDEGVRQKAAAQLGFIGDQRALEPLKRLAGGDPAPGVRKTAETAHQRLSEYLLRAEQACDQYLCPPE